MLIFNTNKRLVFQIILCHIVIIITDCSKKIKFQIFIIDLKRIVCNNVLHIIVYFLSTILKYGIRHFIFI